MAVKKPENVPEPEPKKPESGNVPEPKPEPEPYEPPERFQGKKLEDVIGMFVKKGIFALLCKAVVVARCLDEHSFRHSEFSLQILKALCNRGELVKGERLTVDLVIDDQVRNAPLLVDDGIP